MPSYSLTMASVWQKAFNKLKTRQYSMDSKKGRTEETAVSSR